MPGQDRPGGLGAQGIWRLMRITRIIILPGTYQLFAFKSYFYAKGFPGNADRSLVASKLLPRGTCNVKIYRLEIKPTAEKDLSKIPAKDQAAMRKKIEGLKTNPRPHGCKKLTDYGGAYRLRHGNYRIIYTVHDKELVVVVVEAGDRKSIY